MKTDRIREAADIFLAARRDGTRIDAIPEPARPADLEEGYAIQDAVAAELARRGDTGVGWKIACTSEEARVLLGAPGPFTGRIHASVFAESPGRLSAARFHAIGVEGEFAFTMGRTLEPRADPYTETEVAAAAARLHPAIEVVSPRFTDWLVVGAPSLAADHAVGGALVIGPGREDWRALDLEAAAVEMTIDGATAQAGTGRLALGGPLAALTWSANDLSRRGIALEAGQVVTTGTCTGVQFVGPGAAVVARFADLGEVRIEVTA